MASRLFLDETYEALARVRFIVRSWHGQDEKVVEDREPRLARGYFESALDAE